MGALPKKDLLRTSKLKPEVGNMGASATEKDPQKQKKRNMEFGCIPTFSVFPGVGLRG